MKKILVLEDQSDFVKGWREDLPDFEVVSSATVSGALEKFAETPVEDWVAIVVDGNLPMSSPGYVFVQAVRARGYTGIMIAASSNEKSQKELLTAGCSHAAPGKWHVPDTIRKALV